MRRLAVVSLLRSGICFAQIPKLKPGWNLFSEQQDIQLGKEAAAQVEQQMQVVKNSDLDGYVQIIGRRLAAAPEAQGNKWPFTFKVVNDPTLNAFALPGGPMFIHTGLFPAADNDAQLAGVMAHEMAHVILRHGTSQASKANIVQLPLVLAGAMAGSRGGMMGALGQLGIGLAGNSVLMRFSRDAEKQADILGAQMMSSAGYNPIEMARFFEKLEKQGGGSRMPQFLSDHPNPGNRVKYVSDLLPYLPKRDYVAPSGQLSRAKQVVATIPAPPKQPAGQQQAASNQDPAAARPSNNMKAYSAQTFQISYPDNWETFGDQQSGTVTIAPRAALFQQQNGGTAIGYGVIVSHYDPQGTGVDLQRDTRDLVNQLIQSNPGMRIGNQNAQGLRVAGVDGLQTVLMSTSPYQGQSEVDILVTVPRNDGLFYMVFIAPERDFSQVQPVFRQMIQSVRFR